MSAQPAEVAERRERHLQQFQVMVRLETPHSANFVCGVLLSKLNAVEGVLVDAIHVRRSDRALASYERPRGAKA